MRTYKNKTEVTNLHGVPVYMEDVADACLKGRLNLFLQGNSGEGKTQLAKDVMSQFGDKSLFVLGRNDMDTRELFQQINLEKYRTASSSSELRELTDKIDTNLIVVDELPNCVPAVRAQLFNLFDGFIEISGRAYPIGNGYSVGIATGNIGRQFTESANELGRALKDRMHVIIDTDHFYPSSGDSLEVLAEDTNPRVNFSEDSQDRSQEIIQAYKELSEKSVPLEKLIVANYLVHGLDHCVKGSKRKMKDAWPNELENHEQGSDVGLVMPVSMRGAKSVIRLSQALDDVARQKGVPEDMINQGYLQSMMQAYKLVSAYSGVLNEAAVSRTYGGDRYSAIDSVITTTQSQFEGQSDNIQAGLEMVASGKRSKKVLDLFTGRWAFMKDTLDRLSQLNKGSN